MSASPIEDKVGPALNEQRFQMLEDIAKELAGDVTFPTCFDVAERIRRTLDNPNQSLAQISTLISSEPLISAKLIRLANSAALASSDTQVRDVKGAIQRLGLAQVKATAMAIAMHQMLHSRHMVHFADIAQALWKHTLHSAAAAQVLARRLTRINPDEALLAGLVHDLGAFYMLYRATQYTELRIRPDTVRYLIIQWHESIGLTLLGTLGLPEDIVEATRDHDQLRPAPAAPRNLSDLVYLANMLAGAHFEWSHQDSSQLNNDQFKLPATYQDLKPEIDALADTMAAAFQ